MPEDPKPQRLSLSYRKPRRLQDNPHVSATGKPKLDEWIRVKLERDEVGQVVALIHEYVNALRTIARGEVRGRERDYAGETLRALGESIDTRFDEPKT